MHMGDACLLLGARRRTTLQPTTAGQPGASCCHCTRLGTAHLWTAVDHRSSGSKLVPLNARDRTAEQQLAGWGRPPCRQSRRQLGLLCKAVWPEQHSRTAQQKRNCTNRVAHAAHSANGCQSGISITQSANAYDCNELKENVEFWLAGHEYWSDELDKIVQENRRDGQTKEGFQQSRASSLEEAVKWATIYAALCK